MLSLETRGVVEWGKGFAPLEVGSSGANRLRFHESLQSL
jgi:hypothetical protein